MRTEPEPERWRVEELARRADASVDTIRFYQKRRLLPPPRREGRIAWYSVEHEARLARIRDLQRRGFSLAVIRRLLQGELDATDEPLAAAVAAALDVGPSGTDELLTPTELADRSGVPLVLVDAVVREGLLVPVPGEDGPRFTTGDVEIVRAGLRLLETGLPLPDLLALARKHHEATRALATAAVAMFDANIRGPLRESDLPDAEKSEQLVEAFRVLLPSVTTLVGHHFERVLLEVAQEHLEAVGEPTELLAASTEPEWSRS